jgi:hypothetical protein
MEPANCVIHLFIVTDVKIYFLKSHIENLVERPPNYHLMENTDCVVRVQSPSSLC